MPHVVHDRGEIPLVLHSDLRGRAGGIAELSFLEKSLLFAELSMIAYNDENEAARAGAAIGLPDVCLFDNDGSQAYRFRNHTDCVIACRGTEPDQWNDIRADVRVATVLGETVGRVHRGFRREVDDLWPMLEEVLRLNRRPVWFCGHSLGGAMATICAGRCFQSHISSSPAALYTFGSPRVGNRAYVNHVALEHFRWVHNNDIVARLPPTWAGYRHAGQEVYLNRRGRIATLSPWQRVADRAGGWFRGLLRFRVDALADHSIHSYVRAIASLSGAPESGAPENLSRHRQAA